jgi:RNA polymerase sigma factor (sigma-70 family)
MPRGATRDVLRHLTTLCHSGVLGNLNDEQLLERFVDLSDPSAHEAFAALVRRHGPMVFGVCARVLRDTHEAEDAFQATFLVLARKASSVIPRERVANWLYGVAFRTASEARVRAARRRAREEKVAAGLRVHTPDEALHNELRAILDDELSCLPARYRGPIVLCELEGLTRQEAAQRLGVAEGTVSSRLARAKVRLRDRLARRGLALPAGAISLVAIREASATVLSDGLIESTTLAATRVAAGMLGAAGLSISVVSLSEGVLKTMFLTKLKGIAFVLGSSVAVISGAVALGQTGTAPRTTQEADAEKMTVMERKLDQIIEALDRLSGAGNGRIAIPGGAPQEGFSTVKSFDYGKAEAKFDAAQAKARSEFTQPLPLDARVEGVERGLKDVKQSLAELSARVRELENARRVPLRGRETAK